MMAGWSCAAVQGTGCLGCARCLVLLGMLPRFLALGECCGTSNWEWKGRGASGRVSAMMLFGVLGAGWFTRWNPWGFFLFRCWDISPSLGAIHSHCARSLACRTHNAARALWCSVWLCVVEEGCWVG